MPGNHADEIIPMTSVSALFVISSPNFHSHTCLYNIWVYLAAYTDHEKSALYTLDETLSIVEKEARIKINIVLLDRLRSPFFQNTLSRSATGHNSHLRHILWSKTKSDALRIRTIAQHTQISPSIQRNRCVESESAPRA